MLFSGRISLCVRVLSHSGQLAVLSHEILLANGLARKSALQNLAHSGGVTRLSTDKKEIRKNEKKKKIKKNAMLTIGRCRTCAASLRDWACRAKDGLWEEAEETTHLPHSPKKKRKFK